MIKEYLSDYRAVSQLQDEFKTELEELGITRHNIGTARSCGIIDSRCAGLVLNYTDFCFYLTYMKEQKMREAGRPKPDRK